MSVMYRFDEFELSVDRSELRRGGVLLRADALVLKLLASLARNAGRVITKDELAEEVWEGRAIADNAITVAMARLRKAVGETRDRRELIETVYGRGYRLKCKVTAHDVHEEAAPLLRRISDEAPPFVGRERVVTRLLHALALTRRGQGRTCVLIGEPGIGKTCTAETLSRETAVSGVHMAWGYCREAGDTPPLSPWLRVLREMVARVPESRLDEALGARASLLRTLLSSDNAIPAYETTMVHAPMFNGPSRHRTFETLVRAFQVATDDAPWLVFIEDIHRADAASLEFFAYLLDEIARSRIMIVATTRAAPSRRNDTPTSLFTHVLGHRNCERIALERLELEDVKAYVRAVIDDADDRLSRAVFDRSEGNPFFMVELARRLRASEAPNADTLKIPDAALDLIWQRIGQFDERSRVLLSAAAVLGRSFELARLQAVTGCDPEELMRCLDEALATEMLIAAPDSTTAFAFGHELLRSALYESLPASARRAWHLRAVNVLELRAESGESVPASELAYHAHSALPQGSPRKTVDLCRAAAAAAAVKHGGFEVIRYLRYALEALDLIDGASARLRMNLLFTSSLYARSCDPGLFVRQLSEVLRLARDLGDGSMLVRAACMTNVHPGYQPLMAATGPLNDALAALTPAQDGMRSAALAALACAAPQCYSKEQVDALFVEAVPLARASHNPISLYATLNYKMWATGGASEPSDIPQIQAELEDLARRHKRQMPVLPIDLAMFRAFKAMHRGDQPGVSAALEQASTHCRLVGESEWMWHIERAFVLAKINRGEVAGTMSALHKLHRTAEAKSIAGSAPFIAFDDTVVARELTGLATVDEKMRAALVFDDNDPPSVWSMKVRSLAAAGLSHEARTTLNAVAAARLTELPHDAHYLGTLAHLARAAIPLGERDYMQVLYQLLTPHREAFAAHISFLCEGSVAQLLGALAHVLGMPETAIAHLENGVRLVDQAGFALCAADARVELARCLMAERGGCANRHAKELAREAHATTLRLGAHRITQEAAEVAQSVA